MTDQATPAQAGGGAQPIADANPIDNIIDGAETHAKETPEAEPAEPNEPADSKPDEPFPKKAINALSRRDKQIGKLRAEREQLASELEKLRQGQQQQPAQPKPANTGEPQEKDFTNYHDYIRALNKYDAGQLLAERDGKQQQTQQTAQEQAWTSQRQEGLKNEAQTYLKDNPHAQSILDEYGDLEFPDHITKLLLEVDPKVAIKAFVNLANEGKLEDLASMSLAQAAMEIGRVQTQAAEKPKTKAPTPLPASRGSVASGKSLDSMNGNELLDWINT